MPPKPPKPPVPSWPVLPPNSPGHRLLNLGWQRRRNPDDTTHRKIWWHAALAPVPVNLREAVQLQKEVDNANL